MKLKDDGSSLFVDPAEVMNAYFGKGNWGRSMLLALIRSGTLPPFVRVGNKDVFMRAQVNAKRAALEDMTGTAIAPHPHVRAYA